MSKTTLWEPALIQTHIHYVCHEAHFFSSFPTKFIRFACRCCLSCQASSANCISQAFLSAFELEIWRGSCFHEGELVRLCALVLCETVRGQTFTLHSAISQHLPSIKSLFKSHLQQLLCLLLWKKTFFSQHNRFYHGTIYMSNQLATKYRQ